MPRLLVAVLAVFVLVVAGLVAGAVWWADRPEELGEVGDVVELSRSLGPEELALDVAHEVEVLVPTGALVLRIGETVRELADGSTVGDVVELDRQDFAAPDGAAYLPLNWELRPTRSFPAFSGLEDPELEELVTLAVRVGDTVTEIDLDTFTDLGTPLALRSVALVLDEDVVDSATVEVTFEGETQSVSVADGQIDTGRAAALYDLEPEAAFQLPPPAPVTGPVPRGFRVEGDGSVENVEYQPWLPGRGWVEEPGTAWCRVVLRTLVDPSFDDEPESEFGYRMRYVGHAETLDGAAPVDTELEVLDGSANTNLVVSGSATWLVDVVPRELVLSQDVEVVVDSGRGAPLHSFTLSATLDVEAAALGPG